MASIFSCDSFQFDGFLNKPVPIDIVQDVPSLPILFHTEDLNQQLSAQSSTYSSALSNLQGTQTIQAIVDTASPFTVIDFQGSGNALNGELRFQQGGRPDISRFIFHDVEIWDFKLNPIGYIFPIQVSGVIGASILRHFTVSLRYTPPSQLTLSDSLPDSNEDLAGECDPNNLFQPGTQTERCFAVFHTPLLGGGRLITANDEHDFDPSRLALSLCLLPNHFDPSNPTAHGAEKASGINALAIVATGFGMTVISRSLFEQLHSQFPDITESSPTTLYLPSGQETITVTQIERSAIVANQTNELGPCEELALRRRILISSQVPLSVEERQFIEEYSVNGTSAAVLEEPFQVAILDDESSLFQGLRQELQPYTASINMVLGGGSLKNFDVIVDYPSQRMILRCNDSTAPEKCHALPWCSRDQGIHPSCPREINIE